MTDKTTNLQMIVELFPQFHVEGNYPVLL